MSIAPDEVRSLLHARQVAIKRQVRLILSDLDGELVRLQPILDYLTHLGFGYLTVEGS